MAKTNKPQFPTSNLPGRFLNDYLLGRDLLKRYVPYAEDTEYDGDVTILPMIDGPDLLYINHHKGMVSWVGCDIWDLDVVFELLTFAEYNLELFFEKKKSRLYRHESGMMLSILEQRIDEHVVITLQCFSCEQWST